MRITDVKTVLLTGPISNDPWMRAVRTCRSASFVEIHTDDGLVGVGETYLGYFFPEAVPVIVDFFKPILVGVDALDVPLLWERMYRCGNFWCRNGMGAIALAGIEGALWDLKGKANKSRCGSYSEESATSVCSATLPVVEAIIRLKPSFGASIFSEKQGFGPPSSPVGGMSRARDALLLAAVRRPGSTLKTKSWK